MASVRFESLYPPDSREKEIAKIIGYVRAGLSCQLIGLPGVGRSNLLGLLAFNHNVRVRHLGEDQKNYHFLYLNLAEVKNATIHEVNKFLFLHLLESLGERRYQKTLGKIQGLFKDALSSNEPLVLWQNLKKAIDISANQEGLSLVFLMDRFDQYLPNITSEFFLNLRALRSLAKYRFAVVFALDRPLEKTLDISVYKEFYEFLVGHLVYLPIEDKPGVEFRLSYLEKTLGKTLEPQTKTELLTITGGHGKLTKMGAEAILQTEEKVKNLEDFLSAKSDVQAALFEICQALTPPETALLQKIAQGGKIEETEALEFLSNIDLAKKSDHTFALTIPLLFHHLKKVPQKSEEKIYFNAERNEILKGEAVISGGLTAQEFRLLRFFLENPGRVCEREEIIRAVWPETKSAGGISDEAIDQMVFRLRKKLESEANNSQHLLTVKGRGFRFTI